jgi:autotransporter translocation and assembly factor TamB
MKWLKRSWHYLLISLIGLTCLFYFLIIFLLTPSGFRSICALAQVVTHHQLTISAPAGSLRTSISIEKVEWHSSNLDVTMDHLAIEMNLSSLLKRSLVIKHLIANNIQVIRIPTLPKPPSKSILDILKDFPKTSPWPNWLTLQNVSIASLRYQTEDLKTTVFKPIELTHTQHTFNESYTFTTQSSGAIDSKWQVYLLPMATQTNIHLVGSIGHQSLQADGFINAKELTITEGKLFNSQGTIEATLDYLFQSTPIIFLKSKVHHFPYHQKILSGILDLSLQSQEHFSAQINIHTLKNQNEFYVDMSHDKNWSANWNVQINQLSDFINDSSGSVHAKGSFNQNSLEGDGNIVIPTFFSSILQLNGFNAKWNILKNSSHVFSSQLSFATLNYQGKSIKNYGLSAIGDLNHQRINLKFITPGHHEVSTTIHGAYIADQHSWYGLIQKMSIEQSKQDVWQLKNPATLTINAKGVSISPLELSDANYIFYIDGHYDSQTSWEINSHAHVILQPQILQNPLFQSVDVSYVSSIQGKADLIQNISLDSNAKINLTKLKKTLILRSTIAYTHQTLHLQSTVTQNQNKIGTLHGDLPLQQFSQLENFSDLPWTTDVDLHVPSDIYSNLITAFVPTIIVKSDLTLISDFKGTLNHPNLSLQAKQNGDLYSEWLNTAFQKTTLTISTDDKNKHLHLTMMTYINNQPLTLSGDINPSFSGYISKWHLHSDAIHILNQPKQQVNILPNITASCVNITCTLSGIITIPQAQYRIQPFYASNTLPIDDITYVYQNPSKSSASITFSNFSVAFGQDVHIEGYGLHGLLRGSLTLNQKINAPLLLSGNLHLNNAYFQWGTNRLNLKLAQVSYLQTPIDNPNLNMVGERDIQIYALPNSAQQSGSVMVGLSISGSVKSPNINLYSSSSALSQADILSYLLFNQPASSTTLLHSATLLSTLKSAGNANINPISNIQKKLGFTEFGIQAQSSFDNSGNISSQSNEFVVGRKLGKKIYVRYAMGVSGDTGSMIILIYQINPRWSLQSSESLQTGSNQQNSQSGSSAIDLMYQFSK